jgi:hypothetical protein
MSQSSGVKGNLGKWLWPNSNITAFCWIRGKAFQNHAVTSPFSRVWNCGLTKSILYGVQGNKSPSNALGTTLFIDILLRGQNIAE